MLTNVFSRLDNTSHVPLTKRILNIVILSSTALAFLFSDFRYGAFSFADFILITVMMILLLSLNIKIEIKQLKFLLCIVIVLIVNVSYSMFANEDIVTNNLYTQSIKLFFYATTIVSLYNYINKNDLRYSFLTINKFLAFFSIVIGLYITLAIYTEGTLPYERLWHFTRKHPTSYEYQGNPNIVRTRSFFSEPAHFGFYLNMILASIVFNVQKYKKNIIEVSILIIGILSTMSFSMILIMILILSLYSLMHIKENGVNWKKEYYIIGGIFSALILFAWEFLYETIVLRSFNIFRGTDNSATNRIFESWQYVSDQSLIFGNGIGQTPTITNNFAYILSDFGLVGFSLFIFVVLVMLYINFPLGMVIVMLNFSRGGYLAAPFWIVLLFYFLYSIQGRNYKKLKIRR